MARRNLEQLLRASAKNWAQRYTILARSKAPRHIAPYISTSSSVTAGQATLTSSIKVIDARNAEGNISNYGTLDMRAQEYGHPGAVIMPVNGTWLAFEWNPKTLTFRPWRVGNKVLVGREYKDVEESGMADAAPIHPLIKKPQPAFNNGQGYMRPAMAEWTQELLASSARFKDAIRLDIMESFKGLGK